MTVVLFYRLVGDVLLCTAFLSYSGPFNQDFRQLLNQNWMKELRTRKIPFTASLNITDMLVDQTTVSTRLVGPLTVNDEHNLEGISSILVADFVIFWFGKILFSAGKYNVAEDR
jgi:hypothetical protein